DEVFGRINSKSYVQLSPSSFDIENDAQFDSIELVLKYDKYFYNDTIPAQEFKVFEVDQTIEPDEGNYYNTTNFRYKDAPIALKEFLPKINKVDSLVIKIADSYGRSLFTKFIENEINNEDEFLDDFKGLLVEGTRETNTTILGFSLDSYMRMYYSLDNEIEADGRVLDFSFNAGNTFNNISSNKSTTYFESIDDQEDYLSSDEADELSFIQSGIGIVTRIDIPNINALNNIQGQGSILDAKLKMTLKRNSSTNNLFTDGNLLAFIIDRKSNVLADLTFDGSVPVTSVIEISDSEFDADTYVMDMMSFIDLKQQETNEPFFLAIYPEEFTSSVNRYVLNGNEAEDNLRLKLELIYAIYDE
ncbi:MAG: DUF4270 family protein, partial [Flavobacteriaceae bacterium]|nr:DUF4270 family protein [Flavobacteriaceae bacterium]